MTPEEFPVFNPATGEFGPRSITLYRVPEIAAFMHCSEWYVRRRIAAGVWQHSTIGGVVRMSAEQIADAMHTADRGPDVIPEGPLPLGLTLPDDDADDGDDGPLPDEDVTR